MIDPDPDRRRALAEVCTVAVLLVYSKPQVVVEYLNVVSLSVCIRPVVYDTMFTYAFLFYFVLGSMHVLREFNLC